MPLYDVKCDACGEKSEILLNRAEPVPLCPCCAEDALVKDPVQVTAPPSFVGSGWAKDGYSSGWTAPSRTAAPSSSVE